MNRCLREQHIQREKKPKLWFVKKCERVFIALLFASLGLVLIYGIYMLLFFGPYLSLQSIHIEGDRKAVSEDQIMELSGLSQGDNLFWLDLGGVYQRVLNHPWIKTVAVRKSPPGTVMVYAEEYKPVAIVSAKHLYFVTEDGTLFKKVEARDYKEYPVITGILSGLAKEAKLPLDDYESKEKVLESISIIKEFRKNKISLAKKIAEVNYHLIRGYSIVTDDKPLQIVLGHDRLAEGITRIKEFSAAIEEKGTDPQYIMMYEGGQVIVKYRFSSDA